MRWRIFCNSRPATADLSGGVRQAFRSPRTTRKQTKIEQNANIFIKGTWQMLPPGIKRGAGTNCTSFMEIFTFQYSKQKPSINVFRRSVALIHKLDIWPTSHAFTHCFVLLFTLFTGIYQAPRASLVAQMAKICLQCGRSRFYPWVRKIPWRRAWLHIPVFLPGEFYGQGDLAGYTVHRVAKSWTQLSN